MAATCSCGAPLGGNKKFCSRSCHARANRMSVLEWEQKIAQQMESDGWEIISPTACCDRIGIKNGRVYFLEFKPQADVRLRSFQKRVMELAPSMYKIVVGTREANLVPLEVATKENRESSRKKTTTSRFVGVSWDKSIKRWKARIRVNGKRITVGNFWTEEDAARAIDDAILKSGAALRRLPVGPTLLS